MAWKGINALLPAVDDAIKRADPETTNSEIYLSEPQT